MLQEASAPKPNATRLTTENLNRVTVLNPSPSNNPSPPPLPALAGQLIEHSVESPNLDSERPGVFMAASQQDIVPSEITMQHIQPVQVCQGISNLLGCQENAAQVRRRHRGCFDRGLSEPALLDAVLQSPGHVQLRGARFKCSLVVLARLLSLVDYARLILGLLRWL